jgi:hypothetical protein
MASSEVKDTIDAEAQRMYLQALLDRGYKFLFKTWKFGKPYVWVKDSTGHIFLERVPLEDVDD